MILFNGIFLLSIKASIANVFVKLIFPQIKNKIGYC